MTTGFNFIKDMTKEELIEELLAHHKEEWEKIDDIKTLRGYVLRVRLTAYQRRLLLEAGLTDRTDDDDNPWGIVVG